MKVIISILIITSITCYSKTPTKGASSKEELVRVIAKSRHTNDFDLIMSTRHPLLYKKASDIQRQYRDKYEIGFKKFLSKKYDPTKTIEKPYSVEFSEFSNEEWIKNVYEKENYEWPITPDLICKYSLSNTRHSIYHIKKNEAKWYSVTLIPKDEFAKAWLERHAKKE